MRWPTAETAVDDRAADGHRPDGVSEQRRRQVIDALRPGHRTEPGPRRAGRRARAVRDAADEALEQAAAGGKSQDHRDDLPQVVIGVAVTRDGITAQDWRWPGNTSGSALIRQVRTTCATGRSREWVGR
jgi:hypothetical protein